MYQIKAMQPLILRKPCNREKKKEYIKLEKDTPITVDKF